MSDPHVLIMALPNPVIVVDAQNRIAALNAPAQRLIGSDCVGWHYITAFRQPAILDAVEGAMRGDGPRTARYLGRDGARETTWDVSVDRTDSATVVLHFQDMTALEEADQMRRDFVANVSHEMRTPLTSMMGFIETLRGTAKNDPNAQARFLGIMEQEANRMHALVEDLLSLSRVEGQGRMRPTTSVDLSALILQVIDALRPVTEAAGAHVITDLPRDPVTILGDHRQLWQVISNLVENAVKYGGTSGMVKVRLGAPQHEPALRQNGVQLSVVDQGDGIAPHHIARLTERFYRVDNHRNRDVGGTGLGLAIVKHIINRHRGHMQIQSNVGQGTEVTVILPVDAQPAQK